MNDSIIHSNQLTNSGRARPVVPDVAATGRGRGLGHKKQTPGRLRSIALLENPYPDFGEQLLADRNAVERRFAHLTNWGGGLTCLPPWVRTHRRVHRWVQAKLVLTTVKRTEQIKSYVA